MENNKTNVPYGVVVNTSDPFGGNRIQVRMGNLYDSNTSDENLIWCTPLMPKLIHVVPKIGELVFVFFQNEDSSQGNRFYIGPVLSQPQRYANELSYLAQSFVDNAVQSSTTLPNPNLNPDNIGSVPDTDDISIIGRDNAIVTLKPHELRLMCGYKGNALSDVEDRMRFNNCDPAFIQMQYETRTDDSCSEDYNSSISIYADRINFLSHTTDVSAIPDELDHNELIKKEDMEKLLQECHPLVYGDKLVEYLDNFRKTFLEHEHPYAQMPPTLDDNISKISIYPLDNILSRSVKTC